MRYINDAMKKNDTSKDGLINRIIELEWDMFDKVTNTGGRAACQDDEWTFYVMRFSSKIYSEPYGVFGTERSDASEL